MTSYIFQLHLFRVYIMLFIIFSVMRAVALVKTLKLNRLRQKNLAPCGRCHLYPILRIPSHHWVSHFQNKYSHLSSGSFSNLPVVIVRDVGQLPSVLRLARPGRLLKLSHHIPSLNTFSTDYQSLYAILISLCKLKFTH